MEILTLAHVLISLIGIASGFVVVLAMLGSNRMNGMTALFLATTVLTSVTGFLFFPLSPFKPSHAFGILSLLVLAVALYALYARGLASGWRATYVITATLALYLNFFVLIFQSFLKVPALKSLAPTQQEPPFLVAQTAGLLLFVVLGTLAVKRFHPERVGGGVQTGAARSAGHGANS
jgi:hypothetical protein